MIEAGAEAPDFVLPDQDGREHPLSGYEGRTVVLLFYPADFSPTCTDQLSLYEEVLDQFEQREATVLGISVDGSFCHKAFQERLGVTFPLLADFHPKGEVARAYDLWSEDYGVASRAIVVVDPVGTVEWAYLSPPLEVPQPDLVLEALDRLQPA
jgi:peroxiredoxin